MPSMSSAVKKPSELPSSSSSKVPLTEAQLMAQEAVAPEDVLRLERVTEQYLCEPEANVYGLDFTRFKIRDLESDATLFEISKPPGQPVQVCDTEPVTMDVQPFLFMERLLTASLCKAFAAAVRMRN